MVGKLHSLDVSPPFVGYFINLVRGPYFTPWSIFYTCQVRSPLSSMIIIAVLAIDGIRDSKIYEGNVVENVTSKYHFALRSLSRLCADQLETSTSPPPPNSRPLGPKWCSNALPYRRICMSYPTKEQSSSAPPVFYKDILKTIFGSQSLTNATSLPLNSSSRPNTCFITVSNFGARKKKSFET